MQNNMAVFPRCFKQGTAWVGWQGLAHGGASLLHPISKHIGSGAVAAAARHPRLAASTLPPVSLVARGDYNNPPLPLRGYKPPHPPSILPMGKGPRTPTTRHRDNGLGRPQRRPTVNGQGGAAESAPIPSGRGGTAECRPPRPSRWYWVPDRDGAADSNGRKRAAAQAAESQPLLSPHCAKLTCEPRRRGGSSRAPAPAARRRASLRRRRSGGHADGAHPRRQT